MIACQMKPTALSLEGQSYEMLIQLSISCVKVTDRTPLMVAVCQADTRSNNLSRERGNRKSLDWSDGSVIHVWFENEFPNGVSLQVGNAERGN